MNNAFINKVKRTNLISNVKVVYVRRSFTNIFKILHNRNLYKHSSKERFLEMPKVPVVQQHRTLILSSKTNYLNPKVRLLRAIIQNNYSLFHQSLIRINSLDYKFRGNSPFELAFNSDNSEFLVQLIHYNNTSKKSFEKHINEPLQLAIEQNKPNMFDIFSQDESLVNSIDDIGRTCLMKACEKGSSKIVESLIVNYNANPFILDIFGKSALDYALLNHQTQSAKAIINGYNKTHPGEAVKVAFGKNGRKAIHLGAIYADQQFVKFLLKLGADINAQYNNGKTVIHNALRFDYDNAGLGGDAKDSDYKEVVENYINILNFLIMNGANVNIRDKKGRTPLMEALNKQCKFHTATVLTLLEFQSDKIDYFIDVNTRDKNDRTPLYCSCRLLKTSDSMKITTALIKRGAALTSAIHGLWNPIIDNDENNFIELCKSFNGDPNYQNEHGDSYLHTAIKYDFDIEIVKRIIKDIHTDVNIQDNNGLTPLHLAIKFNRSPNVISLLIKSGANAGILDHQGWNTLFYTLNQNDIAPRRTMLVNHGANVDVQDIYGMTLLHYAAQSNDCELIIFLNKHGVKRRIKNKDGMTADMLTNNTGIKNLIIFKGMVE